MKGTRLAAGVVPAVMATGVMATGVMATGCTGTRAPAPAAARRYSVTVPETQRTAGLGPTRQGQVTLTATIEERPDSRDKWVTDLVYTAADGQGDPSQVTTTARADWSRPGPIPSMPLRPGWSACWALSRCS